MAQQNAELAFHWITAILKKQNVRFVMTGGFAARVYGSPRPLYDIDIDIPEKSFKLILDDVKPCVTFGPARFRDNEFDIELMTLVYNEQPIDLTAAESIKLYDREKHIWVNVPTDLNETEEVEVFDKRVPIMSKRVLIHYKSIIARKTDLEDIEFLTLNQC